LRSKAVNSFMPARVVRIRASNHHVTGNLVPLLFIFHVVILRYFRTLRVILWWFVHLLLTIVDFSEKLLALTRVNSIGLANISRSSVIARLLCRFGWFLDRLPSCRYLSFEVVPDVIKVGGFATIGRTSRTSWRQVSLVLLVHLLVESLLVLWLLDGLPLSCLNTASSKVRLASLLK
jgi:hypothetical protein